MARTESATTREPDASPIEGAHPTRGAADGASLRWPLIGAILLGAFTLRVWGAGHELPFVYNPDEQRHFVPYAISFFENGYNPKYFVNPPGFSYLLHAVFTLRYGAGDGAVQAFLNRPGEVFLTARVATAALGALAVWLLYLAGARLFNARVGLLSAALMAVAFLPTFYGHLALNDAPVLVPVTLSLLGSIRIMVRGKPLDYVIAGAGLGLACATKYPGGVVLLPLLTAAVIRIRQDRQWTQGLLRLGLAALAAVAGFLLANPFALLDYRAFLREIDFLSPGRIVEASSKLGTSYSNGWLFYLWTMTWGLGWVPTIAAAAGMVIMVIKKRSAAVLLVPAPILYVLYMGAHTRFFARWLLPVFPFLVIMAAYAVVEAVQEVRLRLPRLAPAIATFAIIVLLLQPLAHAIHSDLVLTRPNTRTLARDWMFQNIPAGSPIVLEPIYLDLRDHITQPLPGTRLAPQRWRPVSLAQLLFWGGFITEDRLRERRLRSPQWYVESLRPELVDVYLERGICWVVTGSSQWGRAINDSDKVPRAIEYYRELARTGQVALHLSPFRTGSAPSFDFDLSSNFYQFEVSKPGPEIIVYSMPGAGCR